MVKPLLASLLTLSISACGNRGDAGAAERDSTVAVVGVTVIPMDTERVEHGQTVIVRNGLIVDLGGADVVQVPAGAQRVDGTGSFLMPGLTDAHVHLRDPGELLSYLAHGVTTVVHLSGPSGNVRSVMQLREQVRRGEMPGPTIYTSGRILDGDPPIFSGVSATVRTSAEATSAVASQVQGGADLIKVYNNLRAEALKAVTDAAHARGISVWGHIPRVDGRATALQRALSAGLDVIAHAEEVFFTLFYEEAEDQLDRGLVPTVSDELITEAVRLIQKHGTAVIPNLSFAAMTRRQLDDLNSLWAEDEAQFLAPEVRSMWEEQNPTTRGDLGRFNLRERGKQAVVRRLTKAMSDAGIPLLLGTDASAPGMFPGTSAHLELTELVAAGLSSYQALATGTTNPGHLFREHHRARPPFGTVTEGSRADLLLLNANPLAKVGNIGDIRGVMVRGKWYSRARLDSMRIARANPR